MSLPRAAIPPAQLSILLERLRDDRDRLAWSEQIFDDDLFVLERLVILEKPAYLPQDVAGQQSPTQTRTRPSAFWPIRLTAALANGTDRS